MKKQVLSMLLAMMMLLSVVGMNVVPASAEEYTNATGLLLDGQLRMYEHQDGEDAWFKFDLTTPGKLNLKVMSYIDGNLGVRLCNADLSETLYSWYTNAGTATSPQTTSNDAILSSGTYYIKICDDWSCETGSYKISATFTPYTVTNEVKGTYDSPQIYTLGSEVVHAITPTQTENWYRITIPTSGYYVQRIRSNMGGGVSYVLYNQDLTDTIASDAWGTADGSEAQEGVNTQEIYMSAGTYYVKLYKYYHNGLYKYMLSPLTPENCNHEYETKQIIPSYTQQGYTLYTCKKCGHTYNDSYINKNTVSQGVITNCTAGKKKATITWYSDINASGYQIRYSTDKKLKKSVKTVNVSAKKTSKVIKKLKRKKKYYFQVRTYVSENGQKIYGKWSKKKSVKVK